MTHGILNNSAHKKWFFPKFTAADLGCGMTLDFHLLTVFGTVNAAFLDELLKAMLDQEPLR